MVIVLTDVWTPEGVRGDCDHSGVPVLTPVPAGRGAVVVVVEEQLSSPQFVPLVHFYDLSNEIKFHFPYNHFPYSGACFTFLFLFFFVFHAKSATTNNHRTELSDI